MDGSTIIINRSSCLDDGCRLPELVAKKTNDMLNNKINRLRALRQIIETLFVGRIMCIYIYIYILRKGINNGGCIGVVLG